LLKEKEWNVEAIEGGGQSRPKLDDGGGPRRETMEVKVREYDSLDWRGSG
jgi:hypothetical protein